MRQLTSPLPEEPHQYPLVVLAADESGFGNVCHRYEIGGYTPSRCALLMNNDATMADDTGHGKTTILFHRGPVHNGRVLNGVTVQSLLAVIGDRLLQGTTEHVESGLDVSEVLKNLLLAAAVLDKRDARLRAEATAYTAPARVPALH